MDELAEGRSTSLKESEVSSQLIRINNKSPVG